MIESSLKIHRAIFDLHVGGVQTIVSINTLNNPSRWCSLKSYWQCVWYNGMLDFKVIPTTFFQLDFHKAAISRRQNFIASIKSRKLILQILLTFKEKGIASRRLALMSTK